MKTSPGLIVLLGSGETQPSSGKTHDYLAQQLPKNPRIAILETPAGFELNSDKVALRIKDFLSTRLMNYNPEISVIPARKRGTPFSPDNSEIVEALLSVDEILLGPGSPTYAVRQLRDSLALQYLAASHRAGTALVLSSAATLAFGAQTIPIYEIYKVGEDPFWVSGLNFFAPYGLEFVIIPHWNNRDGGDELDTSHCYIGRSRFDSLYKMLPDNTTVLGLDDHTSLVIDLTAGRCMVMGRGSVHLLKGTDQRDFTSGDTFSLDLLGKYKNPAPEEVVPAEVWQATLDARQQRSASTNEVPTPPQQALDLLVERNRAREKSQWQAADQLRNEIIALGWQVVDTPEGSQLQPLD